MAAAAAAAMGTSSYCAALRCAALISRRSGGSRRGFAGENVVGRVFPQYCMLDKGREGSRSFKQCVAGPQECPEVIIRDAWLLQSVRMAIHGSVNTVHMPCRAHDDHHRVDVIVQIPFQHALHCAGARQEKAMLTSSSSSFPSFFKHVAEDPPAVPALALVIKTCWVFDLALHLLQHVVPIIAILSATNLPLRPETVTQSLDALMPGKSFVILPRSVHPRVDSFAIGPSIISYLRVCMWLCGCVCAARPCVRC
eukprot:jgi/Chlat1/2939/Chrsp2S04684